MSERDQAASVACGPGAECDCPFCPDATHGGERGIPLPPIEADQAAAAPSSNDAQEGRTMTGTDLNTIDACRVCGAVDPQTHDGMAHDLDGRIAYDRQRAIREGVRNEMLRKAAQVSAFRVAVPRLMILADVEDLSDYLSVLNELGLRAQVVGWEAPPFPLPFLVAPDDNLAALSYPVTIMAATLASVHAGLAQAGSPGDGEDGPW